MKILSSTELATYEMPPVLKSEERKSTFSYPKQLLAFAMGLRTPSNQIGFLLSCGYFKAAKRFFAPSDFHPRDIEYVARKIDLSEQDFDWREYTKNTRLRHEHHILDSYGFKRLGASEKQALQDEIAGIARTQLKPKLIFARCLDYMIQNRMQLPSARKLSGLIISALQQRKHELTQTINKTLAPNTRELLDQLFESGDNENPTSPNARYKLTLLKKLSHSTKPTKVKGRTADLQLLEELHQALLPVLSALNLGAEGIRYYAGTVIKSEIFQLTRRSEDDRHVHVIAFITHQYYQLQDNLVDVLLNVVKNSQNSAQREHKERVYDQRRSRNQAIKRLLSRLDEDVFSVFQKIRKLVQNEEISDSEKLATIRQLLADKK